MAVIKSGATSDQLTVDATSKAARVTQYDTAGAVIGAVTNPVSVAQGIAVVPVNGGFYSVAGRSGTAAIAATLAADTPLAAMRLVSSSSRIAYVKKVEVEISIITVGTSALVPGTLGLQRFTAGNPTGGTVRTPAELDEVGSNATDMTQIQDLNAALTMTSVVYGTVLATNPVPIVITGSTSSFTWLIEPPSPIVLVPGDGLTLKTQVACPATQTWMFTWTAWWEER